MSIPRTEVPSGDIDGVNTSFVTPFPYTPGTLLHYLNGQLKVPVNDDGLIEDDPSAGTFTLKEAPKTGDVLQARYLDTTPVQPGEEVQGLFAMLSDLDGLAARLAGADVLSGIVDDVDIVRCE
jgi:hypothetical protein